MKKANVGAYSEKEDSSCCAVRGENSNWYSNSRNQSEDPQKAEKTMTISAGLMGSKSAHLRAYK